jgi:3-phosphoinositide dependent protein kinase-1
MFKNESEISMENIKSIYQNKEVVEDDSHNSLNSSNDSSDSLYLNDKVSEEQEIHMKKKRNKRNTFVGTAEYVSPEVLDDQEVGTETDLWALGCIIYQMFTGVSPFKDKTEYLTFKKILDVNLIFPPNFPESARDLINSLLVKDPSKRLGSGSKGEENNFQALKSHPFFTGVAWDELNGSSAPHSHEFIIKPEKDIKPKTKSINQVENNNRNTLTIIKQDIKEKKSPWFHYNTRKVF